MLIAHLQVSFAMQRNDKSITWWMHIYIAKSGQLFQCGVSHPPILLTNGTGQYIHHVSIIEFIEVTAFKSNFFYFCLQDSFPNFATEPPPIADLQKFYKESKKRFDEDEAFKKRAYEAVVKLQAYEPLHKKGWEEICEISRKEFMKVFS